MRPFPIPGDNTVPIAAAIALIAACAWIRCGDARAEDAVDAPAEGGEAVIHFDRGVAFFMDEMYDAALAEFIESYAAIPYWAVLYNIGVCYYRLGRYDDSLEKLKTYLAEGGELVPTDRRAYVEGLIDRIESTYGAIVISCATDGARVTIDGRISLVTPAADPVPVAAGLHQISAWMEGFYPYEVEVTVPSQGVVNVPIDLDPATPLSDIPKDKAALAKKMKLSATVMWAIAGLSLASAAITGSLAVSRESEQDRVILECWPNTGRSSCPKAWSLRDEGKSLVAATNGLLIAAGVTAIAALVLHLVLEFSVKSAHGQGKHAEISFAPVGPDGGPGFAIQVKAWHAAI